ncbi:uncharacterized mitochondrial protein AtMg00810-like [Helianthus annuus]|uniref:uncharacterized mitochondrial protein AtMg00810-like n=1 Tax=Helianthus annuus TaxID=4232 RepID=UPI000B8F80AA|nr:uncharacterized mitochondrial protein AtMg00810-like [Helianthus annuus]
MDVKNAFLYGELDHVIFMDQPRDAITGDLIITGDLDDEIAQLKANLCVRFRMKDLGKLVRFLGLELAYNGNEVILHQTKYASDMLHKFGMISCKAAPTPIESRVKLYSHVGRELEDPTVYRKIVGSLIYLTLTRPDVAFAVGVLSRYMQDPRKPHYLAILRVLRYMKGTMGNGVMFKREQHPMLMGLCDSDYAGDLNERRSTIVYVFM